MNDTVLETIKQYSMLKEGDRVVVGVSGGADSVALLDFLHSLKDTLKLDIVACHVNHNLRGAESDRDEAFVKAMAHRLGVAFELLSIDAAALAASEGKSIEEAARQARYNFFDKVAAGGKIATAHTASDNLETVIFNLTRGTGLTGLCGIPPVRGQIIRPLIACSRNDIETYCCGSGIEYITDSSNLTDDYTRNVIRHHVTPRLLQINAAAESGVAQMCQRLRLDNEFLSQAAESMLEKLGDESKLSRSDFLLLHQSLQFRIIKLLFEKSKVEPSSRLIELAYDIILNGSGQLQIAADEYIYSNKQSFGLLRKIEIEPYFEHQITLPNVNQQTYIEINTKKITIISENYKNFEKVNNSLLKNYVDCDKLFGNVTVRQKKDGDKITLNHRGITKSLKKLFQEQGLTPEQKSRCLIATDEIGVIWAEGFGVDKRVMPSSETRQVIEFKILY